ncbi:hypothetical protein CMI47_22310 [Candidatus Pacearchaeota archaeon]|nr:hypothetical protein [Candidatus Pacearchaeota archaeon]|tara:strand:- start:7214 stop:7633 length:420 start_codon:yes stop_codon:yes gene_type:complete
MRKLIFSLIIGMFFVAVVSANFAYYDPTSDVTTNWDEGTGITFAEIDDATRQPTAPAVTTYVADNTQGADGVSEFNFDAVTETPDNMTLWIYTATGGSCSYNFLLQQSAATRCSDTIAGGLLQAGNLVLGLVLVEVILE